MLVSDNVGEQFIVILAGARTNSYEPVPNRWYPSPALTPSTSWPSAVSCFEISAPRPIPSRNTSDARRVQSRSLSDRNLFPNALMKPLIAKARFRLGNCDALLSSKQLATRLYPKALALEWVSGKRNPLYSASSVKPVPVNWQTSDPELSQGVKQEQSIRESVPADDA